MRANNTSSSPQRFLVVLLVATIGALGSNLLSRSAFATDPVDEQAAAIIRAALQSNDEALRNLAFAYRYERVLALESPDGIGHTRRQGIYSQCDGRHVLEQVEWSEGKFSDNSSMHEVHYFDGQRTYTWSGWNNSGRIRQGMSNMGGSASDAKSAICYRAIPLGELFVSSTVANLKAEVGPDGTTEWSFELSDHPAIPSRRGQRVHLVLSERYGYLPRIIQNYEGDSLVSNVEVAEYQPVPESEGVSLKWFPKHFTRWDNVPYPVSGKPRPAGEVEILKVAIGFVKPDWLKPLAYPRGCAVFDESTQALSFFGGSERQVRMDELSESEVRTYFPLLGLGTTLAEAKAWARSPH